MILKANHDMYVSISNNQVVAVNILYLLINTTAKYIQGQVSHLSQNIINSFRNRTWIWSDS